MSKRRRFLGVALLVFLSWTARAGAAERHPISGTVTDVHGAPIVDARVSLFDAGNASIASVRTNATGGFALGEIAAGSYLVVAEAPGFPPMRRALEHAAPSPLALVLGTPTLREEVSVTATPGRVEGVDDVAQAVSVIDERTVAWQAKSVVAQIAEGQPGAHLQRTSPTMAGIFVRGLTGAKVNVFVDGQRYSNGSARGGVNTFLDLIEPGTLESAEILRGPSSAQYGSDAIGGSVQFLTRSPEFLTGGRPWSGRYGLSGGSADASAGGFVTTSYSAPSFAALGTLSGRRVNTLRTGAAGDSRGAVVRFLGLDPRVALDGDRLPDTAFSQYGGQLKLSWAPDARSRLAFGYLRSQQDGGRRYDQLLGGDGNLVADLRNLMLDLASLRYHGFGLGFADSLSLSYSFNAQREERVNQGGNGNPRASINHEYEKTRVHGVQASLVKIAARHTITLGGDAYFENLTAPSFAFDPVARATTRRRGRVPDGTSYRQAGAYLQDVFGAGSRLQLVASARLGRASYEASAASSPLVNGRPLWPDDRQSFTPFGFRVGAVARTGIEGMTIAANVSRGFRAPHVTDLGTLGFTGSGFETNAASVRGLGALVGTTADDAAVSIGQAVETLRPETSLSYEGSLRVHRSRWDAEVTVFVNDVDGNIQKQALILRQGAVGVRLGDEPIVRQTTGGAVFVEASSSPVLVNANFDDARIWGVEHTFEARPANEWALGGTLTYLHAEDRRTGRPPNIEGGTPAPEAWLRVKWSPAGKSFWIEPYVHGALRQARLSTLDLEDRRTGATRSRSSIASFFNNGARARGLVESGADGVAGTADDVLIPTGETLSQVQTRLLGTKNSAPLFPALPGYVTVNVRASLGLGGEHYLLLDAQNLTDRNYRGISWGLDAPGRGISVRYEGRF